MRGRSGRESARLVAAGLMGAALRHARWREPTESEAADAVAELQEIVVGRDDGAALLAETAGILAGFHEAGPEEAKAAAAAELCRLAGADEALIPQWFEEGRRRAAAARMPPTRYA